MKKKGHPHIPDFSSKRPGAAPVLDPQAPKVKPMRAAPLPGGKPHSTSKKSGRRGA